MYDLTSNILHRIGVYLEVQFVIDRPSHSLSIDVHYLFRHIEKHNPTVDSHHQLVLAGETISAFIPFDSWNIHYS